MKVMTYHSNFSIESIMFDETEKAKGDDEKINDFKLNLKLWSIKNNISHVALND